MSNQIVPFSFENHSVRWVEFEGEYAVVAKDMAEALGYQWKGVATIGHVPEEWRGVYSVQTPRGEQEMLVLKEQGFYFFLGRSDKPKALPFQKWYAGEVLPSIRKTGSYALPGAVAPALGDVSDPKAALAAWCGQEVANMHTLCQREPLVSIGDLRQVALGGYELADLRARYMGQVAQAAKLVRQLQAVLGEELPALPGDEQAKVRLIRQ